MGFTDRTVAALKPKAVRYEKWEGGGFGIRVGTSGRKSWVYVYHYGGKPRRMTLGEYPKVKLSKARIAFEVARDKVQAGEDPGAAQVDANVAERNAETVGEMAAEYIEKHLRKRTKASSAAQDERMITVDVLPSWRNRKSREITRRDIVKLLDAIEARGAPVHRNRVASLLSRLFRFGLNRGIVDASPAVGIERLEEKARERVVTAGEIRALWNGLDAAEHIAPGTALAIKLALATGQRRGEVAGIARDEINDNDALWILPGERTKNGRPNIIPLAPLALQIVRAADPLRIRPKPTRPNRKDRRPYDPTPSRFLFPSPRGDKPIEPAALTRALNRYRDVLGIGDATIHDLRRTFATAHGELGTAPEILKALLNHTPQDITERVYNRAENIEPRRKAMQAYCAWLETVIAGASDADNVIRLSVRRAS